MAELFQETVVIGILAAMVRIATPILLAALGELVAERTGVYNMGLEGTMLMGAFAGFLAAYGTGSPWLGVVAAMAAGGAMGLVLAVMTVTLKVEQIVTGLTLNLLAFGLSVFLYKIAVEGASGTPTIDIFAPLPIPYLSDLPYLGPVLFSQQALTYVAFLAVPVIWLFLYRTKYGLELRCIGENPKALDTKGLSVYARQYAAVVFGGVMAGLGGAVLTVGSSVRFVPEITNGRGWLAIVIVIAGAWRPGGVVLAALVFAFLDALQLQMQGVGMDVPYQVLLAMPYVAAILALALRRSRSGAPLMLGLPYSRD